ncbi:UDP-glucose dehydrogenase family protein [Candidatus Deianiraea vastatrix]|uniref:UDP-glucose 6-dehydrogenase n=1 Tax=Candidatus Deianiraea vastatrix TaxID=2163644 RepID=A0A5B8XDH1_9RICK|nr:UDP-glucose/GDP-mannose dehydrogenase family protein [Candidatus Deianiraea vastatrix]QED23313.1 UDP-glucose 6-dehydrogenase [Candidatus Deianiraea vastatrix]
MLNIVVIGCGYVGLPSGFAFASFGHNVTFIEKDTKKLDDLKNGKMPIYEPKLDDLFSKNKKNIAFIEKFSDITDPKVIDIYVIAVGTPTLNDCQNADLSYVFKAVDEIASIAHNNAIVITKSTVPVGTNAKIKEKIPHLTVVSSPEFLREGSAVDDFLYPDRVVIGCDSLEFDKSKLINLYGGILSEKIVFMDTKGAELVKYASNTFLAAKIAFANEISRFCDKEGIFSQGVLKAVGMDKRIGDKFLNPGPGFGGSCFPKDIDAMEYQVEQSGLDLKIIKNIKKSNDDQKKFVLDKIEDELKNKNAKNIALLGLAFKANTSDIRCSIAIDVVKKLTDNKNITITAYDPEAMDEMRHLIGSDRVKYSDNAKDCIKDARIVVVLTEWAEFHEIKWSSLPDCKIVLDFRNICNKNEIINNKIEYYHL